MKAYSRIKKIANITLDVVSSLEKRQVTVADIGTDHGYLAELLSRDGNVGKVIASDISQKCLDKVIKIKNECGLDKIETRLGDGLQPIESADLTVVAGVGGFEIIKMLKTQNLTDDGKFKCKVFVLQPSQNALELRKWLFENEIFVERDVVFESAKRFYPTIVVDVSKNQKNEFSIFNLWLGRDNTLENSDFVKFLKDVSQTLEFLNEIPEERIKNDEILNEKYQLKNVIDKMLKS
ncbi:MAG: SAM-dependent methyltransferase [Clostridia bacterium]|nr:SAM-dependent methyltransferase [Clostridia bacterium]